MISDNMSHTDLLALLKPNETIEQRGLYVAKGISDRTVWDKHAVENPTHAVISAADEKAADEKSVQQIEDIQRHVTSEDVLLDFGCGYGRVAKYLLPTMILQGYIGLDSSCEMLSIFRERYIRSDEEQRTPVLMVNADIHTVPLKDQSVDVVIVCAVFLHNHKDVVKKAMGEIRRILKPGGTLLVYSSFPRSASLMGLQGGVYQMILNLGGKPFTNGPVRYYSKQEVLDLLKGFEEVELYPVGFSVLPKTLIFLPGILEKVYRVGIANPINSALERLMPTSAKAHFAVHYDVVAKR